MLFSPYTPGSGARPPSFAGRADLLEDADNLLARVAHSGRPAPAPLVWTGVRGVGKTVALHEARRLAQDRNFLTVHLTADRTVGLGRRLAEAVAEAVAAADVDRAGATWKRLAERLTSFDLSVSVAGVVTVGRTGRPDSDQRHGRDQLRALLEDACDQGTRAGMAGLALTVDEVQEAPEADRAALVNTLQDLAGGDRPIVTVLAGLPVTPERLMAAGSFAERFAYRVMHNLEPAAAHRVLLDPAADLGVRWSEDAAGLVVHVSRGAPFLLQLYADHIWQSAGPEVGSVLDRLAASHGILEAETVLWNGQYRGRWRRATPLERDLLVAIARHLDGDGVAPSGAVYADLGRSAQQLSSTRASLIDKGLVESDGRGRLAFTAPGFERFVLAQADGAADVAPPVIPLVADGPGQLGP